MRADFFSRHDDHLLADPLERTLLAHARKVFKREIAPRSAELDRTGEFPWVNMRVLNELGLNTALVPAAYGGAPVSFVLYLRIVEELSRACPSTAITWSTTCHAIAPLIEFGSEAQKQRYLPAIAKGGLAALAITEESGGSDARAIRTTLTPDGDSVVVDGRKLFITNGDVADVIVVFAQHQGIENPRDRMTAVLVPRDAPGLRVVRKEDKLGHRASSTVELELDGCRLSRDDVLGEPGQGFAILLSTLNRSRPSVAAEALGIAMDAFDTAVSYTAERRQFSRRVLEFQAVQFMLAEIASKITTARALLFQVGACFDAGVDDLDVEVSMLKVQASDAAMEAATAALQLHGGVGYMTGARVERLFRDAKLTQIWEGANELHRSRVGLSFLKAAIA